jgi:ribosomal protein S27E
MTVRERVPGPGGGSPRPSPVGPEHHEPGWRTACDACCAIAPSDRVDLTTASGRCTGCRRTLLMAEALVFDHAPGVVVRCPRCDKVLLRLVRGPGRAWLDLCGLTYLQLPTADKA